MTHPVRIAVADAGYGSKVALPVYAELEEFEPVAVWSWRPERARELADEAGLELGRRTSMSFCGSTGWRRSTSRRPS